MPPAALMLRTASSTAICADSPTVAPPPVSGIIAPILIGARCACAVTKTPAAMMAMPNRICFMLFSSPMDNRYSVRLSPGISHGCAPALDFAVVIVSELARAQEAHAHSKLLDRADPLRQYDDRPQLACQALAHGLRRPAG